MENEPVNHDFRNVENSIDFYNKAIEILETIYLSLHDDPLIWREFYETFLREENEEDDSTDSQGIKQAKPINAYTARPPPAVSPLKQRRFFMPFSGP